MPGVGEVVRAWLICQWGEGFFPVEEVLTEGGFQQSIEKHCSIHGETHREYIRLFFPESREELSTDHLLQLHEVARPHLNTFPDRDRASITSARDILDLYNNTHAS